MKQYKKTLCIALSAVLLASCSSYKSKTQKSEVAEVTKVSTRAVTSAQTTEKTTRPVTSAVTRAVTDLKDAQTSDPYYPVIPISEDDMPSIRSMLTTSDLEYHIRRKLFGSRTVSGSTAYSPGKSYYFDKLLSGEIDLALSSPVSESDRQKADEAGVQINEVPVAKEALVFFVNKDNPVSSLTQEQIRDIYSGKITNWAELGGNDEEIIPYQRNIGSRSQNFMKEFMGDTALFIPVRNSLVPAGDASLFSSIDVYSNETSSIGYSTYSYAVQICENSDSLKAVTIDGITPSEKALADGTYPLLNSICVIHRADPSEKTERFINWLTSDAGQTCILESGYIPLKNIGSPDSYKLYEAKGTGKEMPENYTPSRKISVISGKDTGDLSFIKNEELRKMIKEDLKKCKPEEKDYKYNGDSFYGENGYITFCKHFSVKKSDYTVDADQYLTYDLTENKRIMNYSDLFFKDSDFVPLLNKSVAYIMANAEFGDYVSDNDFMGITGEAEKFTVDGIRFKNNSPYFVPFRQYYPLYRFTDGVASYASNRTAYNLLPLAMVTGEYHDFNDYITTDNRNDITITKKNRHEWYFHSVLEKSARNFYLNYDIVNDSLFHTEEEIRQRNETVNKVITQVREKYETIHPIVEDPDAAPMTAGIICKYNFHADNIYNVMPDCTSESSEYYTPTDYYLNILAGFEDGCDHYSNLFKKHSFFDHHYAGYDQQTGDPLTFEDIFGPEFSDIDESYAMFTYSVSEEPDGSDFVRFIYGEPYKKDGETEVVEIPVVREHLNMNFFIPADEAMVSENGMTFDKFNYY